MGQDSPLGFDFHLVVELFKRPYLALHGLKLHTKSAQVRPHEA